MSARTRPWLRGFLQLGARADKDDISTADIERQEDTVIRALDMLDQRPGVVLADEVGMGKTYEALGVAAAMRHQDPRSRVVVVTPGPDLNNKWHSEFARFKDLFDFGDEVFPASSLAEFVRLVRQHPVVVAPVTIFQSGRGSGAQTYLLSLYFHWKQLHGHTANAIMARFRDGDHERVDVHRARFLGVFELERVEPHLRKAFCRGRGRGAAGLDDLYEGGGLAGFENPAAVKRALYRARFVLTGKLMPMLDLLIVDEAHKLKNPGSLRTRAMRHVFDGRFRKALFLTATPFQLDVAELREVFSLFAGAKGAPKDLMEQVEGLLAAVRDYQHQYLSFQDTWSSLDPAVAAQFRAIYDADPADIQTLDDPSLRLIANQVQALKTLKAETIEPGFRQWMIRSLRADKRTYRQHLRRSIQAAGAEALPFLLYERFIAELFRRHRRTHKAAAEINMVSSYAAAQRGELLSSDGRLPPQAQVYRDLLREVLSEIESTTAAHPKLSDVIADSLAAADRGEKTLIFCTRIATLAQLRRELDMAWELRLLERWRRVYPGAESADIFDSQDEGKSRHGRQSQLQARFHRPQDGLYLALREPYLRTLVPIATWALAHLSDLVAEANRILAGVRVGKSAAERLDYQVAKRCVEQAAVRLWAATNDPASAHREALERLSDPAYVRLGLDLAEDEFENDPVGDDQPRWPITERVARLVIGTDGSLWESQAERLMALAPALRVQVVEQLARYLTFKQVPFLPDLLGEAHRADLSTDPIESAPLLEYMPQFWRTEVGRSWSARLRGFLSYFIGRDPNQQRDILSGPIKNGDFARHTREGERRERLREAFNSPLHPMVLVANKVMQEGLDLHKHCRRIIHHDLEWNPAEIEQRIGRIDRLGSLTARLRGDGAAATLDVLYPVIRGTIDERLYGTVKTREKWLEFLLGAAPDFSQYSLIDEEPPPLPQRLGADLAIDLGPR
ncbi:SNF2-related protein [Haliangium sp.]|uniref:SNF2-related protein n=1 Tax=Haliangium sp. TaxID=2663208 RepID=UPI003D0F9FDB